MANAEMVKAEMGMISPTAHATPGASDLRSMMEYARVLATADLLPTAYRRKPGNILIVLAAASALGIDAFTALYGVHVIEGKPSVSANLAQTLVRRHGHRFRVRWDEDTRTATASIVRADDPDYTYEVRWTWERAERAGLTGKQVWKAYPEAMLKARAITEVTRDACPEALAGVPVYTDEEISRSDVLPLQPPPAGFGEEEVVDGEIVSTPQAEDGPQEPVEAEVVVEAAPEPETPQDPQDAPSWPSAAKPGSRRGKASES